MISGWSHPIPLARNEGLELALNPVVVVARRRALRVAVAPAVMARVEEHIPQAAQRRERVVRPAVAFVVPVVVVRHLEGRGEPLAVCTTLKPPARPECFSKDRRCGTAATPQARERAEAL